MFCKYCGKEIPNDSAFCIHCGKKLFNEININQSQNEDIDSATTRNNSNHSKKGIADEVIKSKQHSEKSAKIKNSKNKKPTKPAVVMLVIVIVLVFTGSILIISKLMSDKNDGTENVPILEEYQVSFDFSCEAEREQSETQIVKKGELAKKPSIYEREGYQFIGWFHENDMSMPFDFKQPIENNINLVALWMDINDTTDTDSDDIPDSLEISIGTNPDNYDTDGDGLRDGLEFRTLNLNPLLRDTDENGIDDGNEDYDNDGLSNLDEVSMLTNPEARDSDYDSLTDGEEANKYYTDPLNKDTDGDGVDDGTEIIIGSNPLFVELTFTSNVDCGSPNDTNPISVSVSAKTDFTGAATLNISPLDDTNIVALSGASRGYLGRAYEMTTDGELESAEITFEYDKSIINDNDNFVPRIYYYNEDTQELVELPDQRVEEGRVATEVRHFSKYVLLNKAEVESPYLSDVGVDTVWEDANGDGLNDAYVRMINGGEILYDNSYWLEGVLEIYGDSADWDNDGLLNGEEIEILNGLDGKKRIVIHSNPLLKDSDFDGLDDYTEVKRIESCPMKYSRIPVNAYEQLVQNAKNFSSTKNDVGNDVIEFFNFNKQEDAKNLMLDYFYDYAPEDTIEKNAREIENVKKNSKAVELIGIVSSLGHVLKNTYKTVNIGTELADYEDYYYQTLEMRAATLKDIQDNNLDMALGEISLMSMPETIRKSFDKLESSSAEKKIEGIAGIIGQLSGVLKLYETATKQETLSLAKQFGNYNKAISKIGESANKINGVSAVSVVLDVTDLISSELEINETYSKILANAEAYQMYYDLFLYIRDNSEEGYVREAAVDVLNILSGDITEYYRQLARACGEQIIISASKTALDALGKTNPYAMIASTFADVVKVSGWKENMAVNIQMDTMDAISEGCYSIIDNEIQKENLSFSYNKQNPEQNAYAENYLIQLVQSRIIAEKYIAEFIDQSSITGAVNKLINSVSGKKLKSGKELFRYNAEILYDYSNRLHLQLSKNLPYYDELWDSDAPEELLNYYQGYSFEFILGDDMEYESAILEAYDKNGDFVWNYRTGSYPRAVCNQTYDIGIHKDCYYLIDGSSVVCLEPKTGNIIWKADAPGAGTGFCFDEEDSLYLSSYMGSDRLVTKIDKNGNNIWKMYDSRFWRPYKVKYLGNNVLEVACEEGEGRNNEFGNVIFYLDTNTGEFTSLTPELIENLWTGEYCHASGAGAWGNNLRLKRNGSFTGRYHDTNAGEGGTLDGIEYFGTTYSRSYKGKFTLGEKINDYSYHLLLTEYVPVGGDYEYVDGDGCRQVSDISYGIEDETEFTLFLPNTPLSVFGNWDQSRDIFGVDKTFIIGFGNDFTKFSFCKIK